MIKLRITTDGRIRGLWTDAIDLPGLGQVHVQRASHVEFDDRSQCWQVREATPRGILPRLLDRLLRRACGNILYHATTRQAALAWEHAHFQPGGSGWLSLRP